MSAIDTGLVHLAAGSTSVLVDTSGDLPVLVHWGRRLPRALGEPASLRAALDRPVPFSGPDTSVRQTLLPQHSDAWPGRPALRGWRTQGGWSPQLRLRASRPGPASLTLSCVDQAARLTVETTLELHASGVLEVTHRLTNQGDTPYHLAALEVGLPLPRRAADVVDLAGRWGHERQPQRQHLRTGIWLREGRRGRPGHDAPLVTLVGGAGFTWRSGEVWALHVAWSGNTTHFVEHLAEGFTTLGGGEHLLGGEMVLSPGASYTSPPVLAAYSAVGIDGVSAAFHDHVRGRPSHRRSPRPVTLNTWEAVYFDHDPAKLLALADAAAEVGVERFVLDDGWFSGRRHDRAGLGDWTVDPTVWPDGLRPLIGRVRAHGMQFGLWVEPEMVNPDSDLFREHPDWVLAPSHRLPPTARNQHVVDLGRLPAFDHLLERLDRLVAEHGIDFLKWDHNRDLVDADHDGRPGVHSQVEALYRLLDELRRRHPSLEIESCASGGGRVDLGILGRTDRVWASDTNDPHQRQAIQQWTSVVVPLEMVGSHIGPPRAHLTGRTSSLSFRAVTAMFGSFGIEWDLTTCDPAERQQLAAAVATYKRYRAMLHSGRLVHGEVPGGAAALHGVVAADRTRALFAYVQLGLGGDVAPPALLLPGLDPGTIYAVAVVHPTGRAPRPSARSWPAWMSGLELPGSLLATTGLQAPPLAPDQALLIDLVPASERTGRSDARR